MYGGVLVIMDGWNNWTQINTLFLRVIALKAKHIMKTVPTEQHHIKITFSNKHNLLHWTLVLFHSAVSQPCTAAAALFMCAFHRKIQVDLTLCFWQHFFYIYSVQKRIKGWCMINSQTKENPFSLFKFSHRGIVKHSRIHFIIGFTADPFFLCRLSQLWHCTRRLEDYLLS